MDMTGTTKKKYGVNPFDGPFTVRHVITNGTVVLEMGAVLDTVNIRNIKPFTELTNEI